MSDFDLPSIISGGRCGPLLVMTTAEGRRLAVRDTSVRAIYEVVEDGNCIIDLGGGQQLCVEAPMETVLDWLIRPKQPP